MTYRRGKEMAVRVTEGLPRCVLWSCEENSFWQNDLTPVLVLWAGAVMKFLKNDLT